MTDARNSSAGAVVEANFKRSLALSDLSELPGRVVELFCRCPREVCLARYRQRSADRHPGHFDAERSDEDLWDDETVDPVAGGWRVVEVDTSRTADIAGLAKEVGKS